MLLFDNFASELLLSLLHREVNSKFPFSLGIVFCCCCCNYDTILVFPGDFFFLFGLY